MTATAKAQPSAFSAAPHRPICAASKNQGYIITAMNRSTVLTLLIGLVVGATATYVYWQTKLKHDREFFKEKLLCQKIAERYQ